jgi:hypothetical protein
VFQKKCHETGKNMLHAQHQQDKKTKSVKITAKCDHHHHHHEKTHKKE